MFLPTQTTEWPIHAKLTHKHRQNRHIQCGILGKTNLSINHRVINDKNALLGLIKINLCFALLSVESVFLYKGLVGDIKKNIRKIAYKLF